MQNPVRLAVLDAIARKFDGYLESETVKKICWQESPVIEAVEAQAAAVEVAVVEQVDELPTVTTVFNHESPGDIKSDISGQDLESAIIQLKFATNWHEVADIPQDLINEAWQKLTPEEDARLRYFHQQPKSFGCERFY